MFFVNLMYGGACIRSINRRCISTGKHLVYQLHAKEIEEFSLKYNKHEKIVKSIINENSYLNNGKSITLCDQFIVNLKSYGFEDVDSLQIVKQDPEVINIPSDQLKDNLTRWCGTHLGSDFTKFLILNNPSFLYLSVPIIERRLPLLQGFTNKPKYLVLLLLKCPNVLTEQWEQIQSKIDYLTNVMRVDKAEILQSQALNKSLEHIQLRHNILLRCGLYETPSQYEHKRVKNKKTTFKNPPLKRIVDNEDVSFARKICKISHEEYLSFRSLFELEQNLDEEHYSGSESDSD